MRWRCVGEFEDNTFSIFFACVVYRFSWAGSPPCLFAVACQPLQSKSEFHYMITSERIVFSLPGNLTAGLLDPR